MCSSLLYKLLEWSVSLVSILMKLRAFSWWSMTPLESFSTNFYDFIDAPRSKLCVFSDLMLIYSLPLPSRPSPSMSAVWHKAEFWLFRQSSSLVLRKRASILPIEAMAAVPEGYSPLMLANRANGCIFLYAIDCFCLSTSCLITKLYLSFLELLNSNPYS